VAITAIPNANTSPAQIAPPRSCGGRADRDAGAVLLRVANGPGGDPSGNEHGPGHGLTGMRERVALLGGSLSAGPSPDGGFVVSAVLPLGETA
jgi:signal transduction histidine kinase